MTANGQGLLLPDMQLKKDMKMTNDIQPNSERPAGGSSKPHVVGRFGQSGPYDRYRQTAAFICGYCSIPSERVEDLAEIIRKDAKHDKPYELVNCKKCNTDVEIEFSEPDDEECSYPHFYCPKCYANYYDRQAKESWPELDTHYEEIRERYMESQFDDDDW